MQREHVIVENQIRRAVASSEIAKKKELALSVAHRDLRRAEENLLGSQLQAAAMIMEAEDLLARAKQEVARAQAECGHP